MRSLNASVVMMVVVASKGIITGLLLLPLQFLPYRANALLPYRLPYSPRGYPRQYLAFPHDGDDSSSSSEKSVEGRIQALESEVKAMRETFQAELKSLREELEKRGKTGTASKGFSLPRIAFASRSAVKGPTPPGRGKDTVVASAEEAAGIVMRLYCGLSTEDTKWSLYDYSKREFDDPSEYGLTEEQARRNMIVRQDEAEEKTRDLRKQLASGKQRMEELYDVVCRKVEAGGGPPDAIPVFREACALLNRAVEDAERSMMDPKATRLFESKKEEGDFNDSMRWAEHLFNKLVRDMAG